MQQITTKGATVPVLGLGTYELKGEVATRLVREAIALGYRHVDTAQVYDNEAAVGQGIADAGIAREEVWVTTKVWYEKLFPDQFIDSVVESLDKLQLDRVDLLLVHWPHPKVPVRDYIPLLQQARDAGMTTHVGVSNFTPTQVREALRLVPELITDQVEYHALLAQDRLKTVCAEHDMFVTAYSPIGQGKVPDLKLLADIGEPYGKSAAQVGLRWLVQQGGVAVIPRTSSTDRLAENKAIFDFELSVADVARIDRLAAGRQRLINPSFAPAWENG